MLPLEAGVEVISVYSLAFKRFLEIARALTLDTRVVTDNDKRPDTVQEKYKEFENDKNIRICFSTDTNLFTLEAHLVALNDLAKLNKVLDTSFETKECLLIYMLANKTECALLIFESKEAIVLPQYIEDAIQ